MVFDISVVTFTGKGHCFLGERACCGVSFMREIDGLKVSNMLPSKHEDTNRHTAGGWIHLSFRVVVSFSEVIFFSS